MHQSLCRQSKESAGWLESQRAPWSLSLQQFPALCSDWSIEYELEELHFFRMSDDFSQPGASCISVSEYYGRKARQGIERKWRKGWGKGKMEKAGGKRRKRKKGEREKWKGKWNGKGKPYMAEGFSISRQSWKNLAFSDALILTWVGVTGQEWVLFEFHSIFK